jgi:hypothetical protein
VGRYDLAMGVGIVVHLMMKRIAETAPRCKARMAGASYFLSLLAAVFAEFFVRGSLGIAAGLVAVVFYVAVTLLLYDIFQPVNRTLSLLAAFFNLVGLTFEGLQWNPRRVDIGLVFFARLPHFQVGLPASNSGSAGGVCWFGLADLSVTGTRTRSRPL